MAGHSLIRQLLGLAWPVVLARSSQAVIGFCDALMTASLGEATLAAATTGSMNSYALVILPMGTVFIVQSFAAQLQGKGDLPGARRYAWYGLIVSAAVAVLAAAAIPALGAALAVFPYEPAVHDLMTRYMGIRLLAVGGILGTEVLGNWFGGMGNTRLQMIAGLLAMVCNVFLNWVLIYGHLGAPALGIEGAALASVLASWIAFALLMVIFMMARGMGREAGPVKLVRAELWRMLRFGVPNGINWFLGMGSFVFFINVVVADIGTVALAAMMTVIEINSVSFMPAFGLGTAGAILSGQAIGRGEHEMVPRIVRRTIATAALWQCGVGVLYLLIPGVFMGLFAPPTQRGVELLALGSSMLAISAAWQLFDSVAISLSEVLRAAGDTAWTMWVRLGLGWFGFVPSAYLVVQVWGGGPVAAILCFMGYIAGLSGMFAWRFYVSGAWRRIDLIGRTAPAL